MCHIFEILLIQFINRMHFTNITERVSMFKKKAQLNYQFLPRIVKRVMFLE